MLQVKGITAGYGETIVLRSVSIQVAEGAFVGIVGANGAGKTTLLRAVSGVIPIQSGQIEYEGRNITGTAAHDVVELGLVHVPEGRGVFPFMSVRDNLLTGAFARRARTRRKETLDFVLRTFPKLGSRLGQMAGTLSGGEQQMLAIGRALMASPRVLMLDEPSLGLAPKIVGEVFDKLQELNRQGLTILLVEQNVDRCLQMAQQAYVLENGSVVLSGGGREVLDNPAVKKAYLGLA